MNSQPPSFHRFVSLKIKLLGIIAGVLIGMTILNILLASYLTNKQSQEEAYRRLSLQLNVFQKDLEHRRHDFIMTSRATAEDIKNLGNLSLLYAQSVSRTSVPEFNTMRVSLELLSSTVRSSQVSGIAVYVENSLSHYITGQEAGMTVEYAEKQQLITIRKNAEAPFNFKAWRTWQKGNMPSLLQQDIVLPDEITSRTFFQAGDHALVFQVLVPVQGTLVESFGTLSVKDAVPTTPERLRESLDTGNKTRIIGVFVFFSVIDRNVLQQQAEKTDVLPAIYSPDAQFRLQLEEFQGIASQVESFKSDRQTLYVGNLRNQTGLPYYHILRRWTVQEKTDLLLGAAFSQQGALAKIRETRTWLIGAALVILCLVSLIGLMMVDYMIRPINALSHAAQKLARGDFDIQVNTAANDEIGILSWAFTSMTRQLRENFDQLTVEISTRKHVEEELRKHRDHLEELVWERTAALTQANQEIRVLNARLNQENIEVKADLQESEQKYKMLVEQIFDGHFVLQDGCFVFVNPVFCEMHGYRPEELLGKHFSVCVAHESLDDAQELYVESCRHETIMHLFEYMRLTQDQQRLPSEMTMKTTSHENAQWTVGICRDISERLEMERTLREAERMTHIGRITTSLSHEIRNPLSAINMHLQMLEEYMPMFDEGAQLNLTLSIQEVTRLEKILRQLLDFAKPLRLEIEMCHLNQIIAACLDVVKMQFEQKAIEMSCSLDANLRGIQADKEKVMQVIMNLLLNAFEVSPQQGTLRISSRDRSFQNPPVYEITIEDEGTGIAEQNAQHIFEPFFTTKKRGTGLGLTNARHIIEAHGGRITAENRRSGGALFRVWLPA